MYVWNGEGMKLLGVKSWLTPFLVCFVGPGTCCCNPTGAPQTRAQRNLRFGHPPHSVPLVFPFALLAVPVLLLCSFGACFLFCFSHSHHHTDRHTHPHTDRHTHTHTHRHTHTHTHTDRHTHTHHTITQAHPPPTLPPSNAHTTPQTARAHQEIRDAYEYLMKRHGRSAR